MFAHQRPIVRLVRFLGPIISLMLIVAAVATPPTGARADRDVRPARSNQAKGPSDVYIVQMAESPVVAYMGGIAGYPATAPARGTKVNSTSADVRRYVAYLNSRHEAVLTNVGALANKLYDYQFSYNGFAAALTPAQAAKIAATPGVVSVEADGLARLD